MSESWRNILERAATNLSLDLNQIATPAFSSAQAAVGARRLSPQLSFAESRELLARELLAFSAQSPKPQAAEPRKPKTTALIVPVTAPKREMPPASPSRKQKRLQGVMGTFLSALLTVSFTAYVLMADGQFGTEDVFVWAAYTGKALDAGGGDQGHAALAGSSSAPVVNRSTEDALMRRASFQMSHGDGEGGRAVYEVLARHGSVRGAFALAETYDPATVAGRPDWGLKSDLRLARAWYKKASELGSLSAFERLKILDKRAASLGQMEAQL